MWQYLQDTLVLTRKYTLVLTEKYILALELIHLVQVLLFNQTKY